MYGSSGIAGASWSELVVLPALKQDSDVAHEHQQMIQVLNSPNNISYFSC